MLQFMNHMAEVYENSKERGPLVELTWTIFQTRVLLPRIRRPSGLHGGNFSLQSG